MRVTLARKVLILFIVAIVVTLASYESTIAQEEPSIPLRLASGTFDPVHEPGPRASSPNLFVQGREDGPDYYIVQFDGPIFESDKAAVTRLGATLFDYVPDYAFIAYMDGETKQAVAKLESVRWVGLYQPAYRLSPFLYEQTVPLAALSETDTITVDILLFSNADFGRVIAQIRQLGGEPLDVAQSRWRGKVRATIPSDALDELAAIREVSWIEAAPQWELFNEVAQTDAVMDVQDVWTAHGYTGSGQIVAIADTQLDTGDSATYVDDFRECSGTTPRVTISQLSTATTDTNGHGTHVAGSVLGNGRLDGATCGNFAGHPAGSAPEALGYFQALMDTNGSLAGIPTDLNDLFQPAYDFGARIHTNSWGADAMGQYTTESQEADQFMWDHKDFLILFAAGNSGVDIDADGVIDLNSISSPGTAKNVFTVGASENPGQGSGTWNTWYTPATPINGDARSDDVNGLAPFSSRGPTDDGRTKPDIVAPGIYVNSVRSTQAGGTGDYVMYAGTSMATPLTAGSAVVARQVFSDTETYTPTAAMLKALLANGATDMFPGQYGIGAGQELPTTRPTNQAGWGRVDLEDSLFGSASRRVYWWDQIDSVQNSLNTGETIMYTFEVTSTSTPLAATLAWTDYPGTPAAAGGLVNDLDMHLEGPGGAIYYPNNATQRASSELLDPSVPDRIDRFDTGEKYAIRLTPSQYPVQPAFAKLWFYGTGSTGSVNLNLVLYDNDGVGGAPGTVLCTVLGKRAAWGPDSSNFVGLYPTIVDIRSCPEITSATGDFFLSVEFTSSPTGGSRIAVDFGPAELLSWNDTGSGWTQDSMLNYAWAAVVYEPVTPVTSYDRVNNLVGIDLAAPPTGTYTLTVSGFNVPQGPQPYALALSGALRLLGSETVTRQIDGPGTYKFGNSGIRITFNSEDVDSVAVTTYRNQQPSDGPSEELIYRYYDITASGGTGTFDANVTFGYEEAELNGRLEYDLNAYHFDGTAWQEVPADSRNGTNNTITVNNVTSFSRWSVGSDNVPTAVTGAQKQATAATLGFLPLMTLATLSLGTMSVLLLRRRSN